VTTLGSHEALTAASEFLSRGGFVAEADNAFRMGETKWTTLQMKRGRKSSARAKDATECPQEIRLEWDRGRVSVAASIEPRAHRRGFYYGGVLGLAIAASQNRGGKKTREYSDMMVAISQALDDLLARGVAPEEAGRDWFTNEANIKLKAKKARRRSWILLGVLFTLLIGFGVFVAVMSSRH
jgi:hypothetical protein